MDALSIIAASYGFIANLFPVYIAIEDRNNVKGTIAAVKALSFCVVVYIGFSYLAYHSYEDQIFPSIFDNIKTELNLPSYVIRIMFLIIFICNIPFIFLPGKECALVIIEEIRNYSMSKNLMRRID